MKTIFAIMLLVPCVAMAGGKVKTIEESCRLTKIDTRPNVQKIQPKLSAYVAKCKAIEAARKK
jgi:hypothetical protein